MSVQPAAARVFVEGQFDDAVMSSQPAKALSKPPPKTAQVPLLRKSKYVPRSFVQHNYVDRSSCLPDASFSSSSSTGADSSPVSTSAFRIIAHHRGGGVSDATAGISSSNNPNSSALFPLRLFRCLARLEDDGLSYLCSWQPHGRAFVVHKPRDFEAVMHQYFGKMKFSSFQRQLNLYGFMRISRGRDKGGYYHEYFLRGREYLAHRVQRIRVKGTGARGAANPDQEPNFYAMSKVGPLPTMTRHNDSPPAGQDRRSFPVPLRPNLHGKQQQCSSRSVGLTMTPGPTFLQQAPKVVSPIKPNQELDSMAVKEDDKCDEVTSCEISTVDPVFLSPTASASSVVFQKAGNASNPLMRPLLPKFPASLIADKIEDREDADNATSRSSSTSCGDKEDTSDENITDMFSIEGDEELDATFWSSLEIVMKNIKGSTPAVSGSNTSSNKPFNIASFASAVEPVPISKDESDLAAVVGSPSGADLLPPVPIPLTDEMHIPSPQEGNCRTITPLLCSSVLLEFGQNSFIARCLPPPPPLQNDLRSASLQSPLQSLPQHEVEQEEDEHNTAEGKQCNKDGVGKFLSELFLDKPPYEQRKKQEDIHNQQVDCATNKVSSCSENTIKDCFGPCPKAKAWLSNHSDCGGSSAARFANQSTLLLNHVPFSRKNVWRNSAA